ncbi:hypothetical protein BVI1335_400013 [Burkholderia vietnamiensis]|nr:hypothetical protein BVI1335_400013 [Burkholderia vietnamiensis]
MRVQIVGGRARVARSACRVRVGCFVAGGRRERGGLVVLRLRRAVLVGACDLLRGQHALRGFDVVRVMRFAACRVVSGVLEADQLGAHVGAREAVAGSGERQRGDGGEDGNGEDSGGFHGVLLEQGGSVDHGGGDPARATERLLHVDSRTRSRIRHVSETPVPCKQTFPRRRPIQCDTKRSDDASRATMKKGVPRAARLRRTAPTGRDGSRQGASRVNT